MLFQTTFQAAELPEKSNISCFSYTSNTGDSYPLHCHSYYEIAYVKKGTRYETYDGIPYKVFAGSFFLIPPFVVHSNYNFTEVTDLVLQFSPEFLHSCSSTLSANMLLSVTKKETPFLTIEEGSPEGQLLSSIITIANKQTDLSTTSKIALEWNLQSLLLSLLAHLLEDSSLSFRSNPTEISRYQELEGVINYILTHPEKKLDMKTAAHMCGMSYYYFSRIFQETVGIPYTQYCNQLRIRQSQSLLLTTNLSISEIANAIGIESISYFTRLFKQINDLSPYSYRTKYKV